MFQSNGRNTWEIIQQATGGDTRAFRMLVEAHQGFAYRVAFRMVPDEHDAEDIVQEVFIKLWNNLKKYRPENRFTTWLYRMVVNQCLDFMKSRRVQQRGRNENLETIMNHPTAISPDEELQNNELMKIVYQATEILSPQQRAVFVLRDLEALSVEEVCEILSMSSGAVKSNLYYARKTLSERLKSVYQIPDNKSYEV